MLDEHLTKSYEDYLETIYEIAERTGSGVHSVDIATDRGVTKASVARAVKNLREDGYINQERYGEITLTDKGKAYGKILLSNHRMLGSFLRDVLGVDEDVAAEEGCLIEHIISDETAKKWRTWLKEELKRQRAESPEEE